MLDTLATRVGLVQDTIDADRAQNSRIHTHGHVFLTNGMQTHKTS